MLLCEGSHSELSCIVAPECIMSLISDIFPDALINHMGHKDFALENTGDE